MASRWIVKRGDKEGGPFTSPQLKSLADSGQLRRTDLVTKQGENRYVPAEKVKGLFVPKDSSSPKAGPAKPKAPVQSEPSDDEILDFGVVEIIDDDDDVEPVVVLEESDEEFEVVAIADEDDEDDFDEPRRSRSGRSRRESPSKRGRGSSPSPRVAAPTKPAKPKKPVKKHGDDEDEEDDENGPGLNVFYGLTCVFGGIGMFITLGNEDPNTLESRRNGALLAIVRLLYNIGGRWMVLGLAIALSGVFFWSAYNQFRKA